MSQLFKTLFALQRMLHAMRIGAIEKIFSAGHSRKNQYNPAG
ncbi:MAG TPA: hypothetical protein PKY29_09470 [Ferruginibacter sp.]|nr:hypothetical protein [Ferruginibacter sp.]HRO18221.1 hypothetical protein [Ferruginibacter sp.]HRQ21532.1 hypothetical protein [Ferruginibacter sp.]